MFGTCKGITFIELIIVIVIIGISLSLVIPAFQRRMPAYERQNFVRELNTLVSIAWQSAIQRQKIHRLLFDLEKHMLNIEVAGDKKDVTGQLVFSPLSSEYQKTSYAIPENIEIKQFFISGQDEMGKGRKALKVWFFIAPDGTSQEVIINAFDKKEELERQISLVLNPFTAHFQDYALFQKP